MTDPDDRELQAYLDGDHPLRARYRAESREAPPSALDEAILAQARAAASRRRDRRRWAVPLGLAATLVIGLPLGWQLWQTPEAQVAFAPPPSAPPAGSRQDDAMAEAGVAADTVAPSAAPPAAKAGDERARTAPQQKRERIDAERRAAPAAEAEARAPQALMSAPAPSAFMAEARPVIGYHGFGPARFGDDEEAVRISWGRPLEKSGSEPDHCAYLLPEPRQAPPGIAFMLVDGRFARYDIDTPRYTAPGGGVVGDDTATLRALHGERIAVQPHKYVDGGAVWVVTPPDGGAARLIFEIDAQGQVSRWRVGVPPGVFFVEGCS